MKMRKFHSKLVSFLLSVPFNNLDKNPSLNKYTTLVHSPYIKNLLCFHSICPKSIQNEKMRLWPDLTLPDQKYAQVYSFSWVFRICKQNCSILFAKKVIQL